MLYLSIALVLIALIITNKPITINYTKTMMVKEPSYEATMVPTPLTDEELKSLREETPPSLDDLVSTLNASLFDIAEEDD